MTFVVQPEPLDNSLIPLGINCLRTLGSLCDFTCVVSNKGSLCYLCLVSTLETLRRSTAHTKISHCAQLIFYTGELFLLFSAELWWRAFRNVIFSPLQRSFECAALGLSAKPMSIHSGNDFEKP